MGSLEIEFAFQTIVLYRLLLVGLMHPPLFCTFSLLLIQFFWCAANDCQSGVANLIGMPYHIVMLLHVISLSKNKEPNHSCIFRLHLKGSSSIQRPLFILTTIQHFRNYFLTTGSSVSGWCAVSYYCFRNYFYNALLIQKLLF